MIGIIDSGIGGKGIEKEIKKLLPKAEVVYFSDTENFPYGTKKVTVLNLILEKNVEDLIKRGADIIVLACNSATVTSIKYLREKFDVPIVGVEPAIKKAAEITKTKKIAVFSTPITSKSEATDNLIEKYCLSRQKADQDTIVYKIPFDDLAGLIEKDNTAMSTSRVDAIWSKYKDKNIDTIVLGCTHYTLIRDEIQKIVGTNIVLVDSNEAVAQQVKKLYDKEKEKRINGR